MAAPNMPHGGHHMSGRDGRDEWEDWEDDEPSTPSAPLGDQPLVQSKTKPPRPYSVQRPSRLKSRGRQKAQNAKVGIRLVTDMSAFRKQHIAHQLNPQAGPDRRTGKFVDASALRALEGKPSEESVGSWHWLKNKSKSIRSNRSPRKEGPNTQDLSPADRPIVIGIALPEDDLDGRVISPETATVDTPLDLSKYLPRPGPSQKPTAFSPLTPSHMRSVWSPDTEFGSPSRTSQAASGTYSQAGTSVARGDAPPVPVVPANYKRHSRVDFDDDDNCTPITLFEEDGSPVTIRKPHGAKGHSRSPATVGTRSGWWDHVHTPFAESPLNPFAQKTGSPQDGKPAAGGDWWQDADEKMAVAGSSRNPGLEISVAAAQPAGPEPTITTQHDEGRLETHLEKARILAEENQIPTEQPPPYEPSSNQQATRYRAVFPPGHPLRSQFPPSPGPVSPGLANTMTSQGAINMSEIPLTPATRAAPPGIGSSPLPDRLPGTFVPADRLPEAMGASPAAKIERRRRRHEKEDAMARRFEGFWKGRGCIPENGCYGRRGREGRKRRRTCLGIIAGILAVIILTVVLAVTLTRKKMEASPQPYSFWLNITNFPPVPTGITTVVGPDNSESVTACVRPSTLWSCSLPKEQQGSNEPYKPEQPEFIIQIQYDNSSRQLWNMPDGTIPTKKASPTTTTAQQPASTSGAKLATGSEPADDGRPDRSAPAKRRRGFPFSMVKGLLSRASAVPSQTEPSPIFDEGINPKPMPPPFHEYWFLGNSTDNIVSDRKAGEPTPFYITLPRTLNETAGPNMVTRRGIGNGILGPNQNVSDLAPPPLLNSDGTGAPAQMRPWPSQQPLRLFDRGLPTEHLGFYTFFDKSIYVKSIDSLAKVVGGPDNKTDETDENGGALETEANFIVTWTQTRLHVQIWTRRANTSRLLGAGGDNSTQPGTFPYPITISEDQHGGNFNKKGVFSQAVDHQQKITGEPQLQITNLAAQGTLINHGDDSSMGGFDGGTGGCKCAWTNFVGKHGG